MHAVARVDVFAYALRYAHGSYVMSGERQVTELSSTIVRLNTEDGLQGWGEVCPLGSTYLPASAEGARAALAMIAPALIGLDAANPSAISEAMDSALAGHAYAKSPVDIASWDVLGQVAGQPVVTLLGGRLQDRFPLYVAAPLGAAESMAAFVHEMRGQGIRRFQLKLGGDPHEDAERVRSVLDATGPEDLVIADANGGWPLQDAVIAARLLESFDRVLLEQPCRTLKECEIVRARTTLPMVLDEVIVDVQSLVQAFRAGAMEAVNLKLSRVGGLSKARLMRDLADALGLRVTIEDSWGGDLATAAVSHLAASTRPASLLTVSFMNDWTQEHIAGYEPRSRDGWGSAPAEPGLGVRVQPDLLGLPLFSAS